MLVHGNMPRRQLDLLRPPLSTKLSSDFSVLTLVAAREVCSMGRSCECFLAHRRLVYEQVAAPRRAEPLKWISCDYCAGNIIKYGGSWWNRWSVTYQKDYSGPSSSESSFKGVRGMHIFSITFSALSYFYIGFFTVSVIYCVYVSEDLSRIAAIWYT